MFEPAFRKQMYCIEESTCDFVGTFRRSTQSFGPLRGDSAPGNCALLPPLVMPLAKGLIFKPEPGRSPISQARIRLEPDIYI